MAEPHVVTAQVKKRGEISGEIETLHAHIARSNLEDACEELAKARKLIQEIKGG